MYLNGEIARDNVACVQVFLRKNFGVFRIFDVPSFSHLLMLRAQHLRKQSRRPSGIFLTGLQTLGPTFDRFRQLVRFPTSNNYENPYVSFGFLKEGPEPALNL